MQVIKDNDKIICIIYREDDWVEGLNFITPDDLFIQVGSWWYQSGKHLQRHIHNEMPRTATRTQEMTYVIKGSMKTTLYNEDRQKMSDFIMSEGDLAVFAYGGHEYDILEDNTKILETKNGPFTDVETDKLKF